MPSGSQRVLTRGAVAGGGLLDELVATERPLAGEAVGPSASLKALRLSPEADECERVGTTSTVQNWS